MNRNVIELNFPVRRDGSVQLERALLHVPSTQAESWWVGLRVCSPTKGRVCLALWIDKRACESPYALWQLLEGPLGVVATRWAEETAERRHALRLPGLILL
jgi:hypothetical protein